MPSPPSTSVCFEEAPVKYAAKRTWPDKPRSWEVQGEAATAEAFALDFAADQGLGLGTELVVIEKEGDDSEIQFFKVAKTAPYQLVPAEPRAGGPAAPALQEEPGTASAAPSETDASDSASPAVPNLRPFVSMILYMVKVGVIAMVVIYALAMLFRYIRSALS